MRGRLRQVWLVPLVLWGFITPPFSFLTAPLSIAASRAIGQPNLTYSGSNDGGLSARSLSYPSGIALDQQGNLYAADNGNNRVLEYDAPLTTGMAASRVIGQPDFDHGSPNDGGLSANSLAEPEGVALDRHGNLYVADFGNNRVLEYDAPQTTGMAASRVFGQPDFITNGYHDVVNAASLHDPIGVALDQQGNLYVADSSNARVLEYFTPLTAHMAASRVFGQPDLNSSLADNGGLGAKSLGRPVSVALDTQGNLYVADTADNRVLEYEAPLATDMAASRVLGQPDFTHKTPNNRGVSATSLWAPSGLGLDARGNLSVADYLNNRVLAYDAPLITGMAASGVVGQPDFNSNAFNNGGSSASSLASPAAVALDALGRLYVADTSNSRVLAYGLGLIKLYLPLVQR